MPPQPAADRPTDPPHSADRADAPGAHGEPFDGGRIAARLGGREHRKPVLDPLLQVRASDLEPYTGLGYLSKLFRLIAVLLLVLLAAEVVVGLSTEGSEALRTLLTEASRLIVVAGVLWGAGDLATLLIDIGHDVRATRILLGRQATHHGDALHPLALPADRGSPRETDRTVERRALREGPRDGERNGGRQDAPPAEGTGAP